MKIKENIILLFFVLPILFGASCSKRNADELVMFGGVGNKPIIDKQTRDSVEEAVRVYGGNKEKASVKFVQEGRENLTKNDLRQAIRSFNKAWILSQSNADVYRGFGNILGAQRRFDEASAMFKKAIELNPQDVKLKLDSASIYIGKAYYSSGIERNKNLNEAFTVYKKIYDLNPKEGENLVMWAMALYFAEEFKESWEKVHEAQKLGVKVDDKFLNDLNTKLPETKIPLN
jgi:tetratricopeptide (TPR) repeat protein